MPAKAVKGLIATDLDGTLLRSDGTIASCDRQALEAARQAGTICALVTGRNIYSLTRAVGPLEHLPIDYVVFSTGLGLLDRQQQLLFGHGLDRAAVHRAALFLAQLGVAMTIHDPLPDNHRFWYHMPDGASPDMALRLQLYREHCRPLGDVATVGPAAQLVGMCAAERAGEVWHKARLHLSDAFQLVRTTSPIDKQSLWLEVLPLGINKGSGLAWLAHHLTVAPARTMAIGNDFNDWDMLLQVRRAYVTDEAPAEMRARWPSTGSHDDGAVARAIERYLNDSD